MATGLSLGRRCCRFLSWKVGWGPWAVQRRFRHKTRKRPFAPCLSLIGGPQDVRILAIAAASMLRGPDGTPAFATIASAPERDPAPQTKTVPRRFGPGSADWQTPCRVGFGFGAESAHHENIDQPDRPKGVTP